MADFPSDIGDFVIGLSSIGGAVVVTPNTPGPWPPSGPTTILNIIPSYLYVQYQDDDAMQAFVQAYNIYAQAYLDYFNNLNLPIYTNGNISGQFLDWVAEGIYGIYRPGLPNQGTPLVGPYNTYAYNTLEINGFRPAMGGGFTATTDDIFKRIITWFFYKGDGKTFTPRWLKRRINRFLNGVNGTDVPNDQTYAISVFPTGFKAWTIQLANSSVSAIFSAAVAAGVIELPFQITWTVDLV